MPVLLSPFLRLYKQTAIKLIKAEVSSCYVSVQHNVRDLFVSLCLLIFSLSLVVTGVLIVSIGIVHVIFLITGSKILAVGLFYVLGLSYLIIPLIVVGLFYKKKFCKSRDEIDNVVDSLF